MNQENHELFMEQALALAESAAREGEVPVGTVVVHDGKIIGRGANRREQDQDPTAHAEITAIRQAAKHLGSFRLEETTIYVTLEPCPMCAGAIVNARIPTVVFGCLDPKAGAAQSLYQILEDPRLNHRCKVVSGILADRASGLLTSFFSRLRASKKDCTD
jgi:tRNA(adenine34) deaminase